MALGKDIEDDVIEKGIKTQSPEQCAALVYTVSELVGVATAGIWHGRPMCVHLSVHSPK